MTQALSSKYYTVEEYFALEQASEERHEYFNGEIFVMSGGSSNHSLITTNMIVALKTRLRGRGCQTYDANIRIKNQSGLYTYAEASVVCGEISFAPGRTDTITNPVIIIEVLSDSTRNYDRGFKGKRYMTVPSLQYYILIEQKGTFVERREKAGDGKWLLTTYEDLEATLELPELEIAIPLTEIYDQVNFEEEPH
jgi:Uma2 family endonuclease